MRLSAIPTERVSSSLIDCAEFTARPRDRAERPYGGRSVPPGRSRSRWTGRAAQSRSVAAQSAQSRFRLASAASESLPTLIFQPSTPFDAASENLSDSGSAISRYGLMIE